MIIDNCHNWKDIVYLKTDDAQLERMVVGFKVYPGNILYMLACGTECTHHYDFEITVEKSFAGIAPNAVEND